MRTEQQVLKLSLAGVLLVSALGISFGLFSGSFAILFDGVFSLVDAVMSIVSITLAGLIAKSATNSLSRRTQYRFNMGFWHFEPIVLAVNALLMMSVATYALFQAVSALISGGREVEFGPAVLYAAVVVVLTGVIGFVESRANRKIQSALVAIDVKGWIMAGGVTSALLIAFGLGAVIDGTDAAWLMPYVDPAVLALVALVLIPIPFSTLRKSVAEISLVTPPELKARADGVAASIVDSEGFADARAYVSQQGRARTVDIVFYVPAGQPPRALEDWDAVRDLALARLDGEDPHSWITISFTTKKPPALPEQ
ncbi:cation diffusion facilitator family transporter [Nesterenkonia haasae]|uniref:cation diffusion facilitator family transporter n=1 Tax=Nesterenkonia haasae TaxID=2587813 RepID=UPI00139081E9|nr:cation transporter [Nesterenkonia haasae]NDK30634.1 cation transporter [Nesterenkonia haasae]